jgi:hypothetical protein
MGNEAGCNGIEAGYRGIESIQRHYRQICSKLELFPACLSTKLDVIKGEATEVDHSQMVPSQRSQGNQSIELKMKPT